MNQKLLEYIPVALLQDIIANKCIPIIGAGFSKNVDNNYRKSILDWEQLGKAIADEILDYSYFNPIDSLSAYAHEYSRIKLIERTKQLLNVNIIKPGKTHNSFTELPFDFVCTTNFDFLLEDSYKINQRIIRVIVEENNLSISSGDENITILKLHGDFNYPDRMVLTEEDYDSYINKNPMMSTYITNLLITRTPLFIGYSLEDYDFRMIWQIVKNRLGTLHRTAYTFKVNASNFEITKYKRRGVQVINLPGNERNYASILQNLFIEIKEYWTNNSINMFKTTKEDVYIQLSKPKNVGTNICFIVSSIKNVSLYKK